MWFRGGYGGRVCEGGVAGSGSVKGVEFFL